MSTPFKMTPGRGPYQKTGKGIPMSFQSPLNQQSFQEKLEAAKKAIVDKNVATGKKQKEVRQNSVLDSLNTVVKEGEYAAAKKYGNKARAKANKNNKTGALPEDASEATYKTKEYVKDSSQESGMRLISAPLKQKVEKKPTYEETVAGLKKRITDGKKAVSKKNLEKRQSDVIDSLKTVDKEGENAAAEKYGNKARKAVQDKRAKNTSQLSTGALPEDASENTDLTEQYRRRSKTMK